jgi:hypothetical protein
VAESQALRYFCSGGSADGVFEVTLRSRAEVGCSGEPAAEALEIPGDGKVEIDGTVECRSSRRKEEGSVECGGGECAELAEDTEGSRSSHEGRESVGWTND